MIRSLLSALFALTLVTGSFAHDAATEERILRTAEDTVVASISIRGQAPRVSGSAMIDNDHAQVDVFFVTAEDMIVPNSAERFVFDVATGKITSVGAPDGEVAILPVGLSRSRDVLVKVQSDALSRFAKIHPGMGAGIPDGINPEVRDTKRDADGSLHVTCESFGGIAGMWFGDAITYSYNPAGEFLTETR